MNRLHHLLSLLAFFFLPLLSSCNALASTAANSPSAPLFRSQLEPLLATGQAGSTVEPVRRQADVRKMYARKQCRPRWVPEKARSLRVAIKTRHRDGLQPNDHLVWNINYKQLIFADGHQN